VCAAIPHTGGPCGNSLPVEESSHSLEFRDLDQTVIGNPAHDLIRLGVSFATAIRGSDLPRVTTALMLDPVDRIGDSEGGGHRRLRVVMARRALLVGRH
jgi:hypothetical protein